MSTAFEKLVEKKQRDKEKTQDQKIAESIPLWSFLDMDSNRNWIILLIFRLLQSIFLTKNLVHPDEYW